MSLRPVWVIARLCLYGHVPCSTPTQIGSYLLQIQGLAWVVFFWPLADGSMVLAKEPRDRDKRIATLSLSMFSKNYVSKS